MPSALITQIQLLMLMASFSTTYWNIWHLLQTHSGWLSFT